MSGIQEAERVAGDIAFMAQRSGAASATFTIMRYEAGWHEQAVRVDATWLGTASLTFTVSANGKVSHMVEFGGYGYRSTKSHNWIDVVAEVGDRHRARLAAKP